MGKSASFDQNLTESRRALKSGASDSTVTTMMTPEMINSVFILIQLRFVQGPTGLRNSGLAAETVEGWILSAHVLRRSGHISIKCTMSAKPQWLGNSLNQGSCEYFRNIPSRNAAASAALPRWRRLADVCTYEIQVADKARKGRSMKPTRKDSNVTSMPSQ